MFSIIDLFFAVSVVSLNIAFLFLFFTPLATNKKLYFYFALLSLFVGIYQFYSARYYEASNLLEAIQALKWQVFGAIGCIGILYFFLAEYTDAKINSAIAIFLLVIVVFSAFMNEFSAYSLRFSTIISSSSITLPWGEHVTLYHGEPNRYGIIVRLLYLGILVWGVWRIKEHFAKNRFEAILLTLFMIGSIITLWVAYLIDSNQIEFIYPNGFTYLFLLIAMTFSLGIRLFQEKKMLETTMAQLKQEILSRKEVEHQLVFNAQHDELTGLCNRQSLLEKLQQAIELAKRSSTKVAVLFIDLDHFKEINDSLGHLVGDKVLLQVAQNMKEQIRISDNLARLGGDEFCLLLHFIETPDDISSIAIKILETLRKPINIDEHELYIRGSIGISMYPSDGENPIELLRNADSAMYKAKQNRNSYQFYTEDMTIRAMERVSLETGLRQALKQNEFVVYYQPQINGLSGALIGLEALVRWNHPVFGMVPPSTFIPFAEEVGLIVSIDRWVMNKAINQIEQWYKMGFNPGVLAINLSVKQLQHHDSISELERIFTQTDFKPQWLELEVTESQIMQNPEESIAILKQISSRGVKLAIDDFGTGYSSLSYLKRLPLDKLKIDKSFVDGLPDDDEDVSIAQAIIALTKSLKLEVIAEGVETVEQKDFLVENGCVNIQGYFYAQPMPAEEIEKVYLKQELNK